MFTPFTNDLTLSYTLLRRPTYQRSWPATLHLGYPHSMTHHTTLSARRFQFTPCFLTQGYMPRSLPMPMAVFLSPNHHPPSLSIEHCPVQLSRSSENSKYRISRSNYQDVRIIGESVSSSARRSNPLWSSNADLNLLHLQRPRHPSRRPQHTGFVVQC